MYNYRLIIHHMRLGESNRALDKSGLVGRTKARQIRCKATKRGWLNPDIAMPSDIEISQAFGIDDPVSQSTSSTLSKLHIDLISKWVKEGANAVRIHQVLMRQHGFTGGYSVVYRYIKKHLQEPPKATTVLHFEPGAVAQVDFGQGPIIYDELSDKNIRTHFFVITLAWSRHQYVEFVRDQSIATWLGCHQRAFEWFGGVPLKIIIDNPKCAITKACFHDPIVQRNYGSFAEAYGFIISPCPPYDPCKKGQVESGVKYVKGNFLALRQFRNLQDINKQAWHWVLEEAGNRAHGTTKEKPLTRFIEVEKAFEKTVAIYADDHALLAQHPRGYSKDNPYVTIQEHLPPNARAFQQQDAHWCLEQAAQIGQVCHAVIEDLLTDPVVDYLRAAQGIVRLKKNYGATRLEAACKRATIFNCTDYNTIKHILQKGLDYQAVYEEPAFDELATVYQCGGKFHRTDKVCH